MRLSKAHRRWVGPLSALVVALLVCGLLLMRRGGEPSQSAADGIAADGSLQGTRDGTTDGPDASDPAQADASRHTGASADGTADAAAASAAATPAEDPDGEGPVTLFGRVLTENGLPVAGARVYLMGYTGARRPNNPERFTDSDGGFRFRGDLRGGYVLYAVKEPLLSFQHRGDLPRVVIGPDDTSLGPYNLILRAAQNITLQVRDHLSAKPIEGVSVYARGEMNLSFRTNEDGRAGLTLSEGIWTLDLSAPGYARRALPLDLTGAQPRLIEVGLAAGGLVHGTVTDTSGMLLPDITVEYLVGSITQETRTDADGAYFFDMLPLDETFTLYVHGEGYQEAYFNWQRFGPGSAEKEVNAVLRADAPPEDDSPPRTLTGFVTDEAGAPVPGALLYYGAAWDGEPVGRTGVDGSYQLEVPGTLNVTALGVWAQGFVSSVHVVYYAASEPEQIVLSRGQSLTGRVVDPSGAAVAGALLRPQIQTGRLTGMVPPAGQARLYSDNAGRFQLTHMPEVVHLTAWAWGYGTTPLKLEGWSPGEEVVLTLDPLSVVQGRVADDQGRPLTEITVRVVDDATGPSPLEPAWGDPGIRFWSGDGRFTLRGLTPGRKLRLYIEAPGYAETGFVGIEPVPEEEAAVYDFQLTDKGRRMAGHLFYRSGEPAAGIRLQALAYDPADPLNSYFSWDGFFRGYYARKALRAPWATTDASGAFVFNGLPNEADYDLLVAGRGVALAHHGDLQDLPADQLEDLRVEVVPGCILEGRVNRDDFPTASRLELTSRRNSAFKVRVGLDHEQTTFAVGQLPAGPYTVELSGAGGRLVQMRLDLSEGERRALEFHLEPNAE